jgi:hypothetical protein
VHPSTLLVERAVGSIRDVLELRSARILVSCDGAPEKAVCERYAEYKLRLKEIATLEDFSVVELGSHVGLPGVLCEGFKHIGTESVLVFQHDVEAVRRVDVAEVCSALSREKLQIHHIRLNHRRNRLCKLDSVLSEYRHPQVRVPLLRTSGWSDMPHFTTASFYRERVLPSLQPTRCSRGVENQFLARLRADIERFGFDVAHPRHGTFVYGSMGDPPVVRHLDGRRTTAEGLGGKGN